MRKVVDYRLLSLGFSDRLKFAQNMYNLIDRLNEPSQPEAKDEIEQFKNAITEYERDYDPCALITKTSTSKRNRSGDVNDSSDGEDTTPHAGARDAEELELRGYEVVPDIIVDSKGGTLKSMNPVSRLSSRCLRMATDPGMSSFLPTYSDYAVNVSIAKN